MHSIIHSSLELLFWFSSLPLSPFSSLFLTYFFLISKISTLRFLLFFSETCSSVLFYFLFHNFYLVSFLPTLTSFVFILLFLFSVSKKNFHSHFFVITSLSVSFLCRTVAAPFHFIKVLCLSMQSADDEKNLQMHSTYWKK